MQWLLEAGVFGAGEPPLARAARAAGHRVVVIEPAWELGEAAPDLDDREPLMFHGSLGLAAQLAASARWRPGAYCDVARCAYEAYAAALSSHLVNARAVLTTVAELVADPIDVAGALAVSGQVFVRPTSPLKPFSGRVVTLDGLSMQALDFGFYYDDPSLPIVVAPAQALGQEWRVVVASGRAVAIGGYRADARRAVAEAPPAQVAAVAERAAAVLEAAAATPEPVYVMDLVETERGLAVVELNPFSGADLYGCSAEAVVAAVARVVRGAS